MDYDPAKFWDERYSRLDLTRSGHRDLSETHNRWLYRRKQAVLKRGLQQIGLSPRGKRVLEIGAGIGAYLDFWKRQGVCDLTGLDLSGAATDYLAQRYPDFRFLKRDITEPALKADCGSGFDLVTALDVLYHVVDDGRLEVALRNVAEVLRPGGILALHDQFLHRPTEHHSYICWRSLQQWQEALGSAGFEIVLRRPIFFVMIEPNDCATPRGAASMAWLWRRVNALSWRLPRLTGGIAYAMDSSLGAFLREGPSMELMLARRTG